GGNGDCPSAQPVCTALGTCFGCNSTSDCSGATPACNTSTHTCVPCLDAQNANGTNHSCPTATPACQNSACVTCNPAANDGTTGANGACANATPVCTSDNRCVQCIGDGQCAADQYCTAGNACVAPALVSLAPSASSIQVGQPATLTVTLDRAARV